MSRRRLDYGTDPEPRNHWLRPLVFMVAGVSLVLAIRVAYPTVKKHVMQWIEDVVVDSEKHVGDEVRNNPPATQPTR